MRTALLLLLAFAASGLSATASSAEVWKWVDAKGVTHYSDQPVPGAVKIEVRAGNISQSRSAEPQASDADPDSDSQPEQGSYRTFQIVRPTNDQNIINTGGQVDVEISIAPPLQATHRLNLYLDGRLVTGFPRNAALYALTTVPRGTHTLTAAIADASGNTIQESPPVMFHVRQESVAKPPVGPSLGQPPKPPPRPRPQNTAKNTVLTKQPTYDALNGARPAMDPATNVPVDKKKPTPKPGKP